MTGYAGTIAMVATPTPGPKPEDPGGRGDDFGKGTPVAFAVLLVFFVAVIFLIRSMNKHLKRVPASFDEVSADSASAPEVTTAAAESAETAPRKDA
ncbi:hypothetical protein D5S17_27705 [Pseudonocardiaceae bacterium YIM PH 21723]|nr:hypothetical protein D5S17_27705 [Pseudonocardiaceae bacterium YIM PH 21723]